LGSYSAPAFALGYYKAIQDVTTPNGTILIGPVRCVSAEIFVRSSPLWDGDIYLDVQKPDGTWDNFVHDSGHADQLYFLPAQDPSYNTGTSVGRYPMVVRVRSENQPTVGNAVVYLIATPPPANPLF